jgi:hypothetical protein
MRLPGGTEDSSMAAWLVPFLAGVIKGFTAEIGRPSARPAYSGGHTDSPPSGIVASGGVHNMHWVAVPYDGAQSFKAAFPTAQYLDVFYRAMESWRLSEPEGYQALLPFAQQVVQAEQRYGDCQIFVFYVER